MSEYVAHVNAVPKKASRKVHLEVLKAISDIVMQSAGPKGSTTMITTNNGTYPIYTKDGKKILEHINVFGEVEKGIHDQLLQITEEIVRRVGDGTTSAIRLSYLIFKELVAMEEDENIKMNSYDIIDSFKTATRLISSEVKKNGREMQPSDVYNLCMISTNGDTELSNMIADLYNRYGLDVYIDLKSSTTADYMTKEYDGLTINKGYASPAYANKPDGTCELRNAKIYVFKDPIDTPEMIGFFTRIVYENILIPFENLRKISKFQRNPSLAAGMSNEEFDKINNNTTMTPTVIMCPFISRDNSTTIEELEKLLYGFNKDETTMASKPPICIVNNLSQYVDELADISLLAGCKTIGKYIDLSVQEADIEAGKAPTIDTVTTFCGEAEQIIIDKEKCKFINPTEMFKKDDDGDYILDENGNRVYSTTYESIVSFLTNALDEAKENGDTPVEINRLRRRLNGLTSALVELYIGGISVTDRESLKDLADDAVRNCRSAAVNGVGRATNFEALMASRELKTRCSEKINRFINIIYNAYEQIVKEIYSTSIVTESDLEDEFKESINREMPLNLRTMQYTDDVITSIDSDIAVLDCISRIVTIMFTSNQILVSSAFDNKYAGIE